MNISSKNNDTIITVYTCRVRKTESLDWLQKNCFGHGPSHTCCTGVSGSRAVLTKKLVRRLQRGTYPLEMKWGFLERYEFGDLIAILLRA